MSANTALFGVDDSPELLAARAELKRLRAQYKNVKITPGYQYSGFFGFAWNEALYAQQALAAHIDEVQNRVYMLEQAAARDYSRIEQRVLDTASGIKVPAWSGAATATTGRGVFDTKSVDQVYKDISALLDTLKLKDELAAAKEKIEQWERGQAVIVAQRDAAEEDVRRLGNTIARQQQQLEDWITRDRLVREDRDRAQRELQAVRSELGTQRYRADAAEQTLKATRWWKRMGI